jgi:DNA polymerase
MKPKAAKAPKPRSAADFLPRTLSLSALKAAAATCKGCDLYKNATQTVFGEGPRKVDVMLVGEQPGDQEDQQGRPFVGPAGNILRNALAEAGISPETVYITNAVKHFKWEPQGKRRKHKKPLASEIAACRPWLSAEIQATRPKIIVCLGATAAQSVFGRPMSIGATRGSFLSSASSPDTFITTHPSAILRFPERQQQKEEYARFVTDLKRVQQRLVQIQTDSAA